MLRRTVPSSVEHGRPLRRTALWTMLLFVAASMVVAGCGDDDVGGDQPRPVVDHIDDAVDAVAQEYSAPPVFFEISATLLDVRVVVAENYVDGGGSAASYVYRDGDLAGPEALGDAQGEVFGVDATSIDTKHVFDEIDAQLGDPLITDFAIVGGPDDAAVYDATVRSDKGGQLRVRVNADGRVLEVMAE